MSADLFALQARNALAAGQQTPRLSNRLDMDRARQLGQEFEGFFLGQMLKPMFEGIEVEEPFGGGAAEEMWQSLQVEEMGKAFARAGGVGIADMVVQEMIKMQEIR
ncbi:MAG: rod-binding protein [Rhodospirillales bacterium]|nr:rod-binding protein [Rhodospirillales bacterium]